MDLDFIALSYGETTCPSPLRQPCLLPFHIHLSPNQGVRGWAFLHASSDVLILFASLPLVRKLFRNKRATGLSFTARIERPRIFSSSTFFLHSEWKVSPQEGGQVAPPLRVSNEHSFIVRVPRARGATWLPSTFSSAPLSTLSPPSLCAAPHPLLVPAPSRLRGADAETFRQKPSYALPQF